MFKFWGTEEKIIFFFHLGSVRVQPSKFSSMHDHQHWLTKSLTMLLDKKKKTDRAYISSKSSSLHTKISMCTKLSFISLFLSYTHTSCSKTLFAFHFLRYSFSLNKFSLFIKFCLVLHLFQWKPKFTFSLFCAYCLIMLCAA